MKRTMRWIAALAVACTLLCALGGCSGKDYAIKVGDQIITENAYRCTVAALRNAVLYNATEAESKAFWQQEEEGGVSRADALVAKAQEQLINEALFNAEFERLGLSFSAEEEAAITEAIRRMVNAYGTMTALNEALAANGYTYDEFVEEYYSTARKNKVISHYFSEVTEEQIAEYYQENYVYVKFIYITKEDPATGTFLTGEALDAARAKAQNALDAANHAGALDNFNDLIELYTDVDLEECRGILVGNNGALDAAFTKGAMALKVGEVRIIETEGAFMVTKRVDGMTEEIFDTAMRRQMLEEMKSEEIQALLTEWREDFPIKYNQGLIKKCRPEKMMEN